ncbi:TrbG/VirB9 family P-type conjugative transfer protein [Sphingomonas abietis]|uniref:TrbG/VirB9 family P-type conjugative transfer protein n=1 Tax=Sphingomonas abietis TaxID=3012344 RepID=A0ABY7NQH2_9SPHN|nr:TrbG/VirB9 family P-type conjugative transfer protein [Sphingomonas abietis]WBO23786.1 TrbG/VirB9 family P-type conjugative transfer protein [Sphingomonas abietis]
MNRLVLSTALFATMAASPVIARDPRIATRLYDPARIVTISGRPDVQSTIEFGEDERIENIAVGDSSTWQVTPNKRASLLFVKPMKAPARTNMTVVTDQRTYLFDLVTTPGRAPLYELRFTYPPRPTPVTMPAPAPVIAAVEAPAPKAPETTPADLDFNWATNGPKQLLPSRAFDDGVSTWLAWPKDATMPAILVREPNGEEGPVNYTVKGDYVVVDGVPPQIVLRQGKLIATLTPAPRPPKPVRATDDAAPQTASTQP